MLLDRGTGRGTRGTGAVVKADVEGRVETEEERAGPQRGMGTEAEGAEATEELAARLLHHGREGNPHNLLHTQAFLTFSQPVAETTHHLPPTPSQCMSIMLAYPEAQSLSK